MIDILQNKQAFICDMDGVIYHGNRLLDGAADFVNWLRAEHKNFLFLTNSSERSPRELSQKLARLGIEVQPEHFYTSALATAAFLSAQRPGGSAYVIGETGLINALYEVGITMNDVNPDYVVVGESTSYTYEKIQRAVHCIHDGARLIGCNPDMTGPSERGIIPATGSLIAPIELTTGSKAYFVGKPNPLMMRHALKKLGVQREHTAIIGDRMDTDIIAGIESEIETVLVLSGVTAESDLRQFAYRPNHIFSGLKEMVAGVGLEPTT